MALMAHLKRPHYQNEPCCQRGCHGTRLVVVAPGYILPAVVGSYPAQGIRIFHPDSNGNPIFNNYSTCAGWINI